MAAEPTGQYARRAGFFYEYLTGRRLDFPSVTAGNYVAALDSQAYVTAIEEALPPPRKTNPSDAHGAHLPKSPA